MNISTSLNNERRKKLQKLNNKEKDISINKLNLSSSNKNLLNCSFESRLSAVKSNIDYKQKVKF